MPNFDLQIIQTDLNHAQTEITAEVIAETISAADTDDQTAGDTKYAAGAAD
jgi:hypothetical protein